MRDWPSSFIVPGEDMSEGKSPGAIPFTRIPSGSSSWAREAVACPMADLEYMYGKEKPAVEESYCECASVSLVMRYQSMTVNLTFVHPFMLDVMTI